MAYEFAGFFAYPPLQRPHDLPLAAVWRDVTWPFYGVGLRLPHLLRDDDVPTPEEIRAQAIAFHFHQAKAWIYLTYICWGGDIDFVYGLGSLNGHAFGPAQECESGKVEAVYIQLMSQFGIATVDALKFDPFVRDYWVED